MKLGLAITGALIVGLLSSSYAFGNGAPIRRQFQPETVYAHLEVDIDPTNDVSILRISEADLLKAGYERKAVPNWFGASSPSRQRSIIAALALSLGLAGVFLTRRRRTAAIATALASATIVGVLSLQAWANMSPPRRIVEPDPTPVLTPMPFKAGAFDAEAFLRSTTSVRNPQVRYNILDLVHDRSTYGLEAEIQSRLITLAARQNGNTSPPPIPLAAPPKVTPDYPFTSVPRSIQFGVGGLTPDFANLLQLKPGSGGVRVDRSSQLKSPGDPRDYHRGEVMIKVSAAEQGVKLTLGTRKSRVAPKAVNAQNDEPKPRN